MDNARPPIWQTPYPSPPPRKVLTAPEPRPVVMEKAAADGVTPNEAVFDRPEVVNADYTTLATTPTSDQFEFAVEWLAEARTIAKAADIKKTWTIRVQHRTVNKRELPALEPLGGIEAFASSNPASEILAGEVAVYEQNGTMTSDAGWAELSAGIVDPNPWCRGTPTLVERDEIVMRPDPSLVHAYVPQVIELCQVAGVDHILYSTKRENLSEWGGVVFGELASERTDGGTGTFGDSCLVVPSFSGAQFDAALDLFAREVWRLGGIYVLVDEKDRTPGPAWYDPIRHAYRIGRFVDVQP